MKLAKQIFVFIYSLDIKLGVVQLTLSCIFVSNFKKMDVIVC